MHHRHPAVVEALGAHFDRLAPAASIPLTDIDDAVTEIERIAGLGLRAITVPHTPEAPYRDPAYDRVWAAAQACGLVVTFHMGAGIDHALGTATALVDTEPALEPPDDTDVTAQVHVTRMIDAAEVAVYPQRTICSLVGSGITERFPDLHFVAVEFHAYWLVSMMAAMDKAFNVGIGQDCSLDFTVGRYDPTRPADDQPGMYGVFDIDRSWNHPLRPSDDVRRQVHVTFQDDPSALACRHLTGVQTLLWGNDYPHPEATWPRSRDAVDHLFTDVSAADRTAITGGITARLFGIQRPPDHRIDTGAATASTHGRQGRRGRGRLDT